CYDKAKEASEKIPETVKRALEQLIEKLRGLMGKGDGTLSHTLRAIEAKIGQLAEDEQDNLAEAKKEQSEAEQLFAKVWDEGKKELDKVGEETKKKVKEAVDRILKKIEQEVLEGARKVLEKSLETATHSWDLKDTESS